MEATTIFERFEKQSNDLVAERVVALGTDRIKTYVRRNAYDAQSEAYVAVWTTTGWERVATLPWNEVVTRSYSYASKGPDWTVAADIDLNRLLAIAAAFLEGVEARGV